MAMGVGRLQALPAASIKSLYSPGTTSGTIKSPVAEVTLVYDLSPAAELNRIVAAPTGSPASSRSLPCHDVPAEAAATAGMPKASITGKRRRNLPSRIIIRRRPFQGDYNRTANA